MLTGIDLLAMCRESSHLSKSDLVRACGYVAERPDGQGERIKFTEFYEALLAAKGLVLKTEKRMGRKLTHQTKIQKDGKLLIGSAYVNELGLEPGAKFDIKVGCNSVVLTAANAE